MKRQQSLRHEFVRHVPESLSPGILYVSMEYGMVAHACCCGCGEEVTTPITPTDWKLTYDGESISLNPSVGNWNLPCRSHYVIRHGRVEWADNWSDEQVARERERDQAAKRHYYSNQTSIFDPVAGTPELEVERASRPQSSAGWLRKMWSWLR